MRRDFFEKAFDSCFSDILSKTTPRSVGSRPELKERVMSGTTILAFHYNGGIMLAADRKTTAGFMGIKSLQTIKIHQVGATTGILFAGTVSDIQYIRRRLEMVSRSFAGRYGYRLTIAGQVNFLVSLLREHLDYVWPLEVGIIIAGLNSRGELKLYEILMDGCSQDCDSYVTEGSGGSEADHILHNSRKQLKDKSLSFRQSLNLAIRAIYRSGEKDSCSSDVRIAYPKVAILTPERGFQFVSDKLVKSESDKTIREEEGKDG